MVKIDSRDVLEFLRSIKARQFPSRVRFHNKFLSQISPSIGTVSKSENFFQDDHNQILFLCFQWIDNTNKAICHQTVVLGRIYYTAEKMYSVPVKMETNKQIRRQTKKMKILVGHLPITVCKYFFSPYMYLAESEQDDNFSCVRGTLWMHLYISTLWSIHIECILILLEQALQ